MPPKSVSNSSLFVQALADGEALEVPMNEVEFISFADTETMKAIGTRNLNSCTGVMLVSTRGAILAHISPLPIQTTDPHAGEIHVRRKMTELLNLYRDKKEFRLGPETKKTGIVCGIFMGQIALPDQKELIESILLENLEDNPRPKLIPYPITAGGHMQAAGGTVFVDGRHGIPRVYVEDVDQR
jgi:hypothetical protein